MLESHKEKFTPVKDEMYQLLLAAYCYKRKVEHLAERLRTQSRQFLLEEMIALRLISNEIVLHLCKLDDDDGTWTLRSLKKEVAKHTRDQSETERVNVLAKKYRSEINTFKVKHRNAYIAHRNADDYPSLMQIPDFQLDFQHLIAGALELFETLWGAKVSFGFKLGSHEERLDFKAELGLV